MVSLPISNSYDRSQGRIFQNRLQAADLLSKKLSHYQQFHPLILGIPRGAVPMASLIAQKLNGEFDVILVHKIGASDNPEFAIGSVSEFGALYRSQPFAKIDIENAAQIEITKLKQKRHLYSPFRTPISPENRIVIIVDDGIATGATMHAAICAVRSQNPKKIIVAAPVASPRTIEILRNEADDVIILEEPEDFFSVSQFYEEFNQVTDEDVINIINTLGDKKKLY